MRPDLWLTTSMSWPVEEVRLRVEVVEPRKLTALEWVLLRVVDEFGSEAPSLKEVGEQLGLGDATFLKDTLPTLRDRRMLERRQGAEGDELAVLAFTEPGRRLYRKGQIEGAPSTHGVTFHLDAITDEALDPSIAKQLKPEGERKFLAHEIGSGRTILGLDRTAELMRKYHRDIMRGDTELRQVQPASEVGRIVWRTVELHVTLSREGHLVADAPGLSPRARELLTSRDLLLEAIVSPRPLSDSWPASTADLPDAAPPVMPHVQWRRDTTQLVPVADVPSRALQMIDDAREELIVDAGWLALDGIENRLDRALARGVRVLTTGHSAAVTWHGCKGVRLEVPAPLGRPRPIVHSATSSWLLIADARRGLTLAAVEVRHCGAATTVEAVAELHESVAKEARRARVDFALEVARATWPLSIPRPAEGDNAPEREASQWLEAESMQAALAHLAFRPTSAEIDKLVHDVAPLTAPARALLLRDLTPRVRQVARELDLGALEAAFRTARDEATRVVDADRDDLGARAAIAERLFNATELEAWAAHVLDSISPPHALAEVDSFVARVTPLRKIARAQFAPRLLAALRPLVSVARAQPDRVLEAIGDLIAAEPMACLLLEGASLDEALALREALGRRRAAPKDGFWQKEIERRLPAWHKSFVGAEHGVEVTRLVRLLGFPAGQAALSAWAGQLADGLAAPKGADALAWWLGELAALAPALPDVLSRARQALMRFASNLRELRAERAASWDATREAWLAVGGTSTEIEGVTAREPIGRPPPRPEKKKGGKGR